jgi:cell division protein FtsL
MTRASGQRGFTNFRAIFGILCFVALIFLCVKFVPPYVDNYQLEQELVSVARFSSYQPQVTAADIRRNVIEKAKDIGIPLGDDNVAVEKSGTTVNIDVKYSVQVALPGKVVELQFNPVAGNKIITAR